MISKTLRNKILKTLSTVTYDKIILFGSRSREDYSKQSDVDLLIILKKDTSIHDKIRLSTQIRKKLAGKLIDADILVKDKTDVNYLRDKTGSVVRNAIIDGVPL